MLSNFLFSKPKNVGNAKCRPTIDRVSTNYWPTHRSSIDQLSTKYWQSVGEMSVNEKLYRPRHIWNDYRPCLDRVSTHYRPTIDRYIDRLSTAISTDCRPSVDRLSTECRPSIDQVSTDYRPSVDRYIDRYIDRYLSVDITHSKQDPIYLSGYG